MRTGRDGTDWDGTDWDGTGRDGTGQEGMERDRTGRDGKGRDGTGTGRDMQPQILQMCRSSGIRSRISILTENSDLAPELDFE